MKKSNTHFLVSFMSSIIVIAFLIYSGSFALAIEQLEKGSKGDSVVELQKRLNELGYSVGAIDGDYGNKTKSAIEQFQADHNLDATGIADIKTQEFLFSDELNPTDDNSTNSDTNTDALKAIALGIDHISEYALKMAPALLGGSKSECKVTEVYCLEEEDHSYQFTAIVKKNGSGTMGLGTTLTINKKEGDGWDISEGSSNNMYIGAGLDDIPGDLVWSNTDTSDDRSYDALMEAFKELGNYVDTNGDGHISYDEIFETP